MSSAVAAPAPAPSAQPLTSPGELTQVMATFNEVTARLTATHEALRARVEELQGELREARAAVHRSRHLAMLGEMAAGIAHEVRNPLGSIGLYARILDEDLGDRPPQQSTARKIGAAVARLNAVVGDVLAFARPLKLTGDELDARALLAQALEAARDDGACWRTLRVVEPEAPRRPLMVRGDANLLHQALVNVIRNAAQAVGEGPSPGPGQGGAGAVHLACARRRVREESGASRAMVALSVRDTGPGFPPEVLPRLFQPFFTTRAAGTGLGLAIVHRIADAHGGRVSVRNHPEGGAVVEVLLPA